MEIERVVLRSDDGRTIDLGDRGTFLVAVREIDDWTGGSSHLGRWSYLWGHVVAGMPTGEPLKPDLLDRIAEEAADFQLAAGGELSEGATRLLSRLVDSGRKGEP